MLIYNSISPFLLKDSFVQDYIKSHLVILFFFIKIALLARISHIEFC